MNREEQIAEMAKIICGRVEDDICIIDRTLCDSCCNWARQAEKIYNAGYRKTFTSDLISDTQKAFKEGYMKSTLDRGNEIAELNAENAILKTNLKKLEEKCEELLNEKWDAQDDLDCYYDEMPNKVKQAKIEAVKDFAEKLRKRLTENRVSNDNVVINANYEIDELLKEYE